MLQVVQCVGGSVEVVLNLADAGDSGDIRWQAGMRYPQEGLGCMALGGRQFMPSPSLFQRHQKTAPDFTFNIQPGERVGDRIIIRRRSWAVAEVHNLDALLSAHAG